MSKFMPFFFFGALFLFFTNATADTRVFPPVGCSKDEIRVMGWKEDSEDTKCLSGKELFEVAFKSMGCTEGQTVGYVGKQAVCQASGGFGGTFTTRIEYYWYGEDRRSKSVCVSTNPKTKPGACSCPAGMSAYEISRAYECTTSVSPTMNPESTFSGVSSSSSCVPYLTYECQ